MHSGVKYQKNGSWEKLQYCQIPTIAKKVMEPTKQAFLDHGKEESFPNYPFTLGKTRKTALKTPHETVIFPQNKENISSIIPFYLLGETRTDSCVNHNV